MKRSLPPGSLKLIGKLLLIIVICFVPYLLLQHQELIETDVNYSKFTHKADHLILGVSRAKVGIVPQILQEELSLEGKVLNFAFTGLVSPYHKDYFKLVKRKINRTGRQQPSLFILSVNTGNLGERRPFFGGTHPIYDLYFVNADPNPEYILRNINVDEPLLLKKPLREEQAGLPMFVPHEDGWNERTRKSSIPSAEIYKKFKSRGENRGLSNERLKVLSELMSYLSDFGQVVLVRLPVNRIMESIEAKAVPDFDAQMEAFAASHDATYLNYVSKRAGYAFSDPHHLLNKGARAFTHQLAADLKQLDLFQHLQ